jgi:hypothetical protein
MGLPDIGEIPGAMALPGLGPTRPTRKKKATAAKIAFSMEMEKSQDNPAA